MSILKRELVRVTNIASIFIFVFQVAEIFYKQRQGTQWWNIRLTIGNGIGDHLAIVLVIESVSILCIFAIVRSTTSISRGFFAALIESAVYISGVSIIYDIASNSFANRPISLSIESVLFPTVAAICIVIRGKHFIPYNVIRMLFFMLSVIAYMAVWMAFGFHQTTDLTGTTQYYYDFNTNITEIGFWAYSALTYMTWLAVFRFEVIQSVSSNTNGQ